VRLLAVAFYNTAWFRAIVYLAITIIAARVVDYLLARREPTMVKLLGKEPDSADRTRYLMIRRLVQAIIIIIGVAITLWLFPFFHALSGAILASTAIISGVIGIAARAPIANLVSGIMIAFSQPVRLGDYISVGDVYGTVEEIRFTYTYIRTFDNRRVVIPNEAFASQVVNNYSLGSPGSMVVVSFPVPLSADLETVRRSVLEVAGRLTSPPEGKSNNVLIEDLGAREITVSLHAWAHDPFTRRDVASELRAAILQRLRADGVLGSGAEANTAV
jgi:small-conductance mechanosensitive channel